MAMQALVIAHACYGHNSFFKNNYLFRQWTNADAVIDYMVFARKYVLACAERHGMAAVEDTLDSCHALMSHGIDRYHQPQPLSAEEEQNRVREREEAVASRQGRIGRGRRPRRNARSTGSGRRASQSSLPWRAPDRRCRPCDSEARRGSGVRLRLCAPGLKRWTACAEGERYRP